MERAVPSTVFWVLTFSITAIDFYLKIWHKEEVLPEENGGGPVVREILDWSAGSARCGGRKIVDVGVHGLVEGIAANDLVKVRGWVCAGVDKPGQEKSTLLMTKISTTTSSAGNFAVGKPNERSLTDPDARRRAASRRSAASRHLRRPSRPGEGETPNTCWTPSCARMCLCFLAST